MEKSTAETIVKVYAVLAWIGGLIAIIAAIPLLFGGSALLGGLSPLSGTEGVAPGVAGGFAIGAAIFLLIVGVFDIFVGIGLWRKQNWARIAAIVMSAINLLSFPIGTIIGAVGIWLFGFEPTIKSLFTTDGRMTRATASPIAGKRP